jgi:hypothetical protein
MGRSRLALGIEAGSPATTRLVEHGSSLGTYLAYAAIVLVLLIMVAALARALMMPTALILLQVVRRVGLDRARSPTAGPEKTAESHNEGA